MDQRSPHRLRRLSRAVASSPKTASPPSASTTSGPRSPPTLTIGWMDESACRVDLPGAARVPSASLSRVWAAILGLVFNLAGTWLVGTALWDDWREYAEDQPLVPFIIRVKGWFVRLLRAERLTRVTSTRSTSWNVDMTGGATTVHLAPAPNAPVDQQIEYLRGQVAALNVALDHHRAESSGQFQTARMARDDARNEAATATAAVERLARQIAIGTIRKQMLGLGLIGLGPIASVLPAVY